MRRRHPGRSSGAGEAAKPPREGRLTSRHVVACATFVSSPLQKRSRTRATVVLCVALSASGRAAAAPFDLADAGWEGGKGLADLARAELGEARVSTKNRLDWSALGPDDGLLVLHPERTLDRDELAAFLRAGGRVAILDDYGAGERILSRYHITRVPPPLNPAQMLRENRGLPLAEPVSEMMAGRVAGVHPVVAEVQRLVTNHPTGFSHPDLSPVLRIRARGEADVTIAVAGQVGKGRLFAMGDPSAVINQMLRYPGNRAFGVGLVKYLVDDDAWGARQGKLHIITNRFDESGAFGADNTATREAKDALRTLRAEMQKVSTDGLPPAGLLALSVLFGASLLLWVVSQSARVYQHVVPRFARAQPLVAQGGVAGRAAVLGAPTTHRGLVLLEQKCALEEELSSLLGLERPIPLPTLITVLKERNALAVDTLAALTRTERIMSRAELAVTTGRPLRITREQIESAERVRTLVIAALVSSSSPVLAST